MIKWIKVVHYSHFFIINKFYINLFCWLKKFRSKLTLIIIKDNLQLLFIRIIFWYFSEGEDNTNNPKTLLVQVWTIFLINLWNHFYKSFGWWWKPRRKVPPRAKVYLYDPPHYESSKGSLLVCPNQPYCLVLSLSLDPCISRFSENWLQSELRLCLGRGEGTKGDEGFSYIIYVLLFYTHTQLILLLIFSLRKYPATTSLFILPLPLLPSVYISFSFPFYYSCFNNYNPSSLSFRAKLPHAISSPLSNPHPPHLLPTSEYTSNLLPNCFTLHQNLPLWFPQFTSTVVYENCWNPVMVGLVFNL